MELYIKYMKSILRDLWSHKGNLALAIICFGWGVFFYNASKWTFPEQRELKKEDGIVKDVYEHWGRNIYCTIELEDGRKCNIKTDISNWVEFYFDSPEIKKGDNIFFLYDENDKDVIYPYAIYVNKRKIYSYQDRYDLDAYQNQFPAENMGAVFFLFGGGILLWIIINNPWNDGVSSISVKRKKLEKNKQTGNLKYEMLKYGVEVFKMREVIQCVYLDKNEIHQIFQCISSGIGYYEYFDDYVWKNHKDCEKTKIIRPKKYVCVGKKIYFRKINLLEYKEDFDYLQERYILKTDDLVKLSTEINHIIREKRIHTYEKIIKEIKKRSTVNICMTLSKRIDIQIKEVEERRQFLQKLDKIATKES
ncbi:MAG: hypothetical protein PHC41_03370 [Lachnospiraceae bacterium]|nr:hypothetical protein [Lachnospiraceae bacterium]MDD3615247.1 hypothetical protein [Lachnospiraceae bacterium]